MIIIIYYVPILYRVHETAPTKRRYSDIAYCRISELHSTFLHNNCIFDWFCLSFSFFVVIVCRRTTSGNGCALIFVYMTYTMLPVRLREALVGGLLLSGVHIYFSINNSTAVDWPEVRLFISKLVTIFAIILDSCQ